MEKKDKREEFEKQPNEQGNPENAEPERVPDPAQMKALEDLKKHIDQTIERLEREQVEN